MSSQVIGDQSILTRTIVPFNAVHTVVGSRVSGHFSLSSATGFKQIIRSRAHVVVISSSLTCQVVGPATADKTINAFIGVVPSTLANFPTTSTAVLSIGGSAFATHALIVGAKPVSLVFAPEVAHQIKPQPLIGEAPEIVYFVDVIGGASTDSSIVRVSGSVEVEGVGFVPTW
jgi:hypothetical protein